MELELPYPPTVNHYWKHARGRHFLSKAGKAYREVAEFMTLNAMNARAPTIIGPTVAVLQAWMPDNRQRDVDNLPKGPLDAIQHAGLIVDDSQIDLLIVARMGVDPPGKLIVNVNEFQINMVDKVLAAVT